MKAWCRVELLKKAKKKEERRGRGKNIEQVPALHCTAINFAQAHRHTGTQCKYAHAHTHTKEQKGHWDRMAEYEEQRGSSFDDRQEQLAATIGAHFGFAADHKALASIETDETVRAPLFPSPFPCPSS